MQIVNKRRHTPAPNDVLVHRLLFLCRLRLDVGALGDGGDGQGDGDVTRAEIRLQLPVPPRELHPNARGHVQSVAAARRRYRRDVALLAYAQLGQPLPRPGRVAIHLIYTLHRPMDIDGLVAWFKAGIDTLCAARFKGDTTWRLGITPDDSPAHVASVTAECRVDRNSRPSLTVVLTPVPVGVAG